MLVIRLIVALYLIMLTIACINLGINVTRQRQSQQDIISVMQAYNRMSLVSGNQLLTRVLINLANGYETDSSILLKDRFKTYKGLQAEAILDLAAAQSHLQQSSFEASQSF